MPRTVQTPEQRAESRRIYARRWRSLHKAAVSAYDKQYRAAHKDRLKAKDVAAQATHPERRKNSDRVYYERNREQILARARARWIQLTPEQKAARKGILTPEQKKLKSAKQNEKNKARRAAAKIAPAT